jgi:hypothetical protein
VVLTRKFWGNRNDAWETVVDRPGKGRSHLGERRIFFFYFSRYRQEMCSDGNGDIKLIDEHLLTHFLAFFGLVPRCRLKLSLYLIRGLARSARGVG